MSDIDWKLLIAKAAEVRQHAHAPYSEYLVGAALLTKGGRIFTGCNVENASFGLTLCAERSAIAQMVAAGEREIEALAIVTKGPEAGAPCGLCRQMLAEFAEDLPIALAVEGSAEPSRMTSLRALFPEPFRGDLVRSE